MFLCYNNDFYKNQIFGPDMELAIFSFLHLERKIIYKPQLVPPLSK